MLADFEVICLRRILTILTKIKMAPIVFNNKTGKVEKNDGKRMCFIAMVTIACHLASAGICFWLT